LAGYYRKFVPHFADISAALSDLSKKGTKFVWTVEAERASLDLMSRLATQPILRRPDFSQPFLLAVDASSVAIGAVLLQEVEGIEHPICYYSKKLDGHQKNYTVKSCAYSVCSAFGAAFAKLLRPLVYFLHVHLQTIVTNDCHLSVCHAATVGFTVQKQLNGSRSCLK